MNMLITIIRQTGGSSKCLSTTTITIEGHFFAIPSTNLNEGSVELYHGPFYGYDIDEKTFSIDVIKNIRSSYKYV